jgi:NDP-sugar pyrophosphorylase family protein
VGSNRRVRPLKLVTPPEVERTTLCSTDQTMPASVWDSARPVSRLHTADAAATATCVILGGHQWRRHAFAPAVPRPLLPVAQKPLIGWTLRALGDAGLRQAALCAGTHLPDDIGGWAARADLALTIYEDDALRGPAGCLKDAVPSGTADPILAVEGSVLVTFDLARLVEHHRVNGNDVTIVVQPDGPASPASSERTDRPAGIYLFGPSVLDAIPDRGYCDIKETLLPRLHARRAKTSVYRAERWCPRVLDAQGYLAANHLVICEAHRLARTGLFDEFGVDSSHPGALRHPTARIDEEARIVGPVLIGPDVEIGRGATIVGPASLGPGSVVASGALVSRSVLWSDGRVGRDALVERSVLMPKASVPARETVVGAIRPERRHHVWQSPWTALRPLWSGNRSARPLADAPLP